MPWASHSLGTVEYTWDIWNQVTPDDGRPSCEVVATASSILAAARDSGDVVANAYLDRFHAKASLRTKLSGKRLLPVSTYNEFDEPLPTESALGHLMMTAGIGSDQYFWCNICCAYTGDRVRKLAKECDRVVRNVNAVTSLRKDVHPNTGTMLTVRARRLLKADVGGRLSLLDPPLHTMSADARVIVDGHGDSSQTAVADVCCHPQHSFLQSNCP